MNRYRAKSDAIEAIQLKKESFYDDKYDKYRYRFDESDWPDWLNEARHKEHDKVGAVYNLDIGILCIHTLTGKRTATFGDWVIRDVKWGIYPCKDDLFKLTYEKE